MSDLPIIFLLGPSGVGKDYVATLLMKQIPFLFMDMDIRQPLGHYALRKEWDSFATRLDPLPLAAALRVRIKAANTTRVLLSFPSRRVLTRKHLDAARTVGIRAVLLWGPIDLCKKAALGRDDGRVISNSRYDDANKLAFETYSSQDFDLVRIEVFRADGSRCLDENLLNNIRRLIDAEQHGT